MATSSTSLPVSLNFFGFFSLRGGTRVSTQKGNNTVWHQVYLTTNQCANGQRLHAELWVYSPARDQTLPDDKIILTMAKAFSPKAGTVLGALRFVVFPGDPKSPDYDERTYQSLPDNSRVPVTVGDSTKGSNQTCLIKYVYDGTTKRWVSNKVPQTNSCVQFSGLCRERRHKSLTLIYIYQFLATVPHFSGAGLSVKSIRQQCFYEVRSHTIFISNDPGFDYSLHSLHNPPSPSPANKKK
ncbi:hypothetical protein C8R44DRAFT_731765 [Mycena epipterygia]|nr:hypothetical protein C8R44DRAFT_731765 [Mycena epipterygia]